MSTNRGGGSRHPCVGVGIGKREISGRRGVSGGCTAGLVNGKKCPGSMILRAVNLDVSHLDPRVDGTPVFRRKIEKCRRLVFSPGMLGLPRRCKELEENL